jgi:hypothetical protein
MVGSDGISEHATEQLLDELRTQLRNSLRHDESAAYSTAIALVRDYRDYSDKNQEPDP